MHTSGRHGLAVLEPGRAGRCPRDRHAPGDDVHRHRRRPAPAAPAASSASRPATAERELAERLVADLGGAPMWVPEDTRTLYHAGLAHGANHLVTLVDPGHGDARAPPAPRTRPPPCARCSPPPSTTRWPQGDAALTGPIVRGDVGTVRAHLAEIAANAPHTLPSYVAMARATLDRVVTDGRVLPIRAAKIRQVLDAARRARRADRARPAPDAPMRRARPRAHPRGARGAARAPAAPRRRSASCRRWAPCTTATPA